ncbi:MAG: hypothetical protein A3G11_00875 [Candidatus Lloydbacteria bacterium RIFCSPLOWO2_12_FULL_51_9]|uniref:Uncharacterized protein n=1 Tax=Candidatus Lloydbacteria bacterium RIFCSPLOWO2_12_FULL_51_9 TaxID=1798669 RepID=A0A1G2DT99_9BACT|nr:MAG: hypothetical protein A3G11_00875 [Candidatus Lloydbacteria bacterium RIFCSPLOWO2_12_FULL_51_9]
MAYLFIAAFCSFTGVIPILAQLMWRGGKPAVVQFLLGTLVCWVLFYLSTPSTVWPLWGIFGLLTFLMLIVAMFVAGIYSEPAPPLIAIVFPLAFLAMYVVSNIAGWGMFRADDYKAMIGTVETRDWTQDIQPKDPKHMRMSTVENAVYLSGKAVGQAGTIGSQFQISESHMTLQMVKGELWYVVPLDFAGFSTWLNVDGVPAYVMVHGEDPQVAPKLVELAQGKRFRYTPGAFWGNELERHLRTNGYTDIGLAEFKFEIDDDGKPWWVVPLFKPTISWGGEKVTGILLVDPASGEIFQKQMHEVPAWVDRVVPERFVENYLSWAGEYAHGWYNSWWGKKDLTEPESPTLIYGADNQPDWVSGVTSTNNNDESLVALVYTNSRTGKSVRYVVKGGGTDAAVLDAVDKNQDVQLKRLHGVGPQLYNVYGTMASVVPLLNESHAFQGVAVVNIEKIQMVAVGINQHEAMRKYQVLLSQSGQTVVPDGAHEVIKVEGVVDRFFLESSIYSLHLVGVPHGFTGGSAGFPKLPFSKPGDRVQIEYFASGEDVVPMQKFENLSLPLSATNAQQEVRARVRERGASARTEADVRSVRSRVESMTTDELKELNEFLRSRKQ